MAATVENIVRIAALAAASTNDLLLWSSPWVVSPCSCAKRNATVATLPTAVTTGIIYGIAEPLFTSLLVWVSVPPWLLVLALQLLHGFGGVLGPLCMIIMLHAGEQRASESSKSSDEVSTDADRVTTVTRWKFVLPYLFAVQTSAASNAALLLWVQSFGASSRPGSSLYLSISDLCALGAVVAARYGDYNIAETCHRAQYLGHRGWTYGKHQLRSLALLVAVRMAMRLVLGMSVFLAFFPGDPDLLFGSHRWQWMRDLTGNDLQ